MQSNLNLRVRKARAAVEADVLQKLDRGYRVPSRTSVNHHIVLASRIPGGWRLTCHYEHSRGQWRCPGNQYGHVCWHVLAAVMRVARGKRVAFFEDLAEAEHYQNLGGSLERIKSGDGSGELYAVVRRAK